MRYVIWERIAKGLFLISSFILITSCGNPGGNAPSAPPPPVPIPTPISATPISDAVLKYGETKTTLNGWDVSLDSSDPVETTSLVNGWTVEVLHE